MYQLFVGEIGIPRREFLYEIRFWEARRIVKGYNRRCKDVWSAVRWSTYNIMAAQVGGKEMGKHGIHHPSDLLPLPWDSKQELATPISEEDEAELQALMAAVNARIASQRQQSE